MPSFAARAISRRCTWMGNDTSTACRIPRPRRGATQVLPELAERMLRKILVWTFLAVAAVLAVKVLLRHGTPQSLVKPPKMELPGADRPAERGSSQPAEPANR